MTGPGRLVLLALLLAVAGCTFERRPPREEEGGFEPGPAGAVPSERDTLERTRAAREALERFQTLRREGDADGVRAWMSHDAVVLRSGAEVAWREAGTAADTLLAPGDAVRGWRLRTDARSLGEGRLFVVGYPPPGADGASTRVETLILVPAPDEGWQVRLLHRTEVP